MFDNRTLCFFDKTLFTRLNNKDFSYMGKNISKKLSQELDEITEKKHSSFTFYYLNNLPFTKRNLIVIPTNSHNKFEFFVFNYFEKNNLFYVHTLNLDDYFNILKNFNNFRNKLELLIEREGY